MCGIAGLMAAHAGEGHLRRSLDALAHRGPDGEGQLRVGDVWFGQRRLAIIDPSPAGAQPMTVKGVGTIVFNGEIYNHAELRRAYALECETRTDTEVLLRGFALHGHRFLGDVRGMYAFAWMPPGGRGLVLARDHAGMKPLWVWQGPDAMAFASELVAIAPLLRACGREPRPSLAAIRGYLAFGSIQEPQALLEGVEAVPPDEVWHFGEARTLVRRERIERWAGTGDIPAERAAGEVVAAVRSAVERHLVSDRPVAVFLSGGIDSNVLTAEVSRASAPGVHAISVRLGSAGAEDEPELVRRVARRRGITLHEIELADLAGSLDAAFAAYDQPSVDGLNTYLISAAARRLGYVVALSGVGADEVFGGYAHLRSLPRAPERWLAATPRAIRRIALRSRRAAVRRACLLLDGRESGEPRTRSFRRLLGDSEIEALLGPGPSSVGRPEGDALEVERSTYLKDTLLRDTDVMSMAHGLEIRAPYLDPDVIAVARAIGTRALLDPARPGKWVLRDGWSADLDPGILGRRKSGFTLSLAALLPRRRPWLESLLDSLAARAWLHGPTVRRLARPGLPAHHPAAWIRALLFAQLELHLQRWGDP